MNNLNRNEFIKKNLGLVHACAKRFVGKGIDYDDLFSAGCMGIVKAYDAFDTTRGVKFSTYAVPVILGEIKRLFRDGGSVKVSRSIKELALKISKIQEEFVKAHGFEPSINFISEKLNLSKETITLAICSAAPTISLTDSSTDSDSAAQINVKATHPDLNFTEKIAIKQALSQLCAIDRSIVLMRFFLGCTQTETAAKLNLTQVQVSRKERKILNKLKESLS